MRFVHMAMNSAHSYWGSDSVGVPMPCGPI